VAFTVRCVIRPDSFGNSNTRSRFAVNGRDKVIPLEKFEVNGVGRKVQLLLDSSGAKIKSLKRKTVESTTEAARGIWSGMHVEETFKI
jgi:large subunit ribosomal protein L43